MKRTPPTSPTTGMKTPPLSPSTDPLDPAVRRGDRAPPPLYLRPHLEGGTSAPHGTTQMACSWRYCRPPVNAYCHTQTHTHTRTHIHIHTHTRTRTRGPIGTTTTSCFLTEKSANRTTQTYPSYSNKQWTTQLRNSIMAGWLAGWLSWLAGWSTVS